MTETPTDEPELSAAKVTPLRIAAGWESWRTRSKQAIDAAVAAEKRLADLKAELDEVRRRVRAQRAKVRPVFGVDKA